jgi:ABC-type nitrate/sulfonate/bicarbonate transport system substrate-binding protein
MAGLEYGKDVKIMPRPNTHMHDLDGFRQSFLRGETLTVNVHPWEAEEWTQKGYPILADTTKLFAPRQDRVVVATGRLVNDKPATLKAFLKSYIKASRFIVTRENSEEIKTILERAGFLSDEVGLRNYPKMMEGQWHRLSPDGSLPLEGVEQVIKEQKEAGNISARVELEKVVRLAPLHEAQRELGIEPAPN